MSERPSSITDPRTTRLTVSLSGTNLARAGDYNQRVVLQAVRERGETTRTELVALTGLTAPTIANITRRLEQDGLIRQAGRVQKGRGQPALRLAIDPDGAIAIGLNIDRDHLSLVCLDLAGTVRAELSREIAWPSPDAVVSFVAEGLDDIIARGGIDRDRIIGAGIAIPDQISASRFQDQPERFAAWDETDPAALLAQALPWSIHIDNDAAAAALGVLHLGGGHDCKSFFYLLVNAGLGGGLVLDGSFYRGASGRSGEIGFIAARGADGERRALETHVSLTAVHARLAGAGCDHGSLDALVNPTPKASTVIRAWIDDAADLLLDPLIAVDCLLDPQAILIGGRLPAPLIDALADALARRLDAHRPSLPGIAPIRRAAMPEIAPAIGAALLPFSDRLLPSDSILMNIGRA